MNRRQTTKRNNTTKLALLLLLIAFIVILGASLAFFSDIITGGITGTTGTLDIRQVGTTGMTRWWTRAATPGGAVTEHSSTHTTTIGNLNPGDIVELGFVVENVGNKSAWLRDQVVFTMMENHMGEVPPAGQFSLFPAGTDSADIRSGAAVPLTVITDTDIVTGYVTLTTTTTPIIINGTGANAEEEAEATAGPTFSRGVVLYFHPTATNVFQDTDISLEIMTQAMQFRNNPTPNWDNVVTAEFTLGT